MAPVDKSLELLLVLLDEVFLNLVLLGDCVLAQHASRLGRQLLRGVVHLGLVSLVHLHLGVVQLKLQHHLVLIALSSQHRVLFLRRHAEQEFLGTHSVETAVVGVLVEVEGEVLSTFNKIWLYSRVGMSNQLATQETFVGLNPTLHCPVACPHQLLFGLRHHSTLLVVQRSDGVEGDILNGHTTAVHQN